MNKQEWESCSDVDAMLDFIRGKTTDRKFRLFGCGCYRRLDELLQSEDANWEAVLEAERYADGQATLAEVTLKWQRAFATWPWSYSETAGLDARDAWEFAHHAANEARFGKGNEFFGGSQEEETAAHKAEMSFQVEALRDVFGNQFHSTPTLQNWLSTEVIRIARSIYDNRRFSELPLLAKALIDAGCDGREVLSHCNPGAVHLRGCWLIDMLLGQK